MCQSRTVANVSTSKEFGVSMTHNFEYEKLIPQVTSGKVEHIHDTQKEASGAMTSAHAKLLECSVNHSYIPYNTVVAEETRATNRKTKTKGYLCKLSFNIYHYSQILSKQQSTRLGRRWHIYSGSRRYNL